MSGRSWGTSVRDRWQTDERPGQRRPSVDVELVALRVFHRDCVVIEAFGAQDADEHNTEIGQAARLASTRCLRVSIGTARPPLTPISRCSLFLTALRSGTTWNQIRGPPPPGSTMQSAPV